MIYLASKSLRRRELLEQLSIEYEILDVDIDETWDGEKSGKDYVMHLALEKARAAKHLGRQDLPILAADTEVVLDGEVLGKPRDKDAVLTMLQKLSGRTHHVYSAVALLYKTEEIRVNTNRVSFKPLSMEECIDYCDSGEPFGKAGAYAIQGGAAAFISRLEGSYSGVMGLP